MKKKKIFRWIVSLLWGLAIFLTAYLLGQSASLYLKGKLDVPREITLAKEEVEKEEQQRPLSAYESEILPIFGERKQGQKDSTPETNSNAAASSQQGNPVNEIDWDTVLTNHPNDVRVRGTVIGTDNAIAFLEVEGEDVSLYIGQKVGKFQVTAISKNTVTFRNGDQKRIVSMVLNEKNNSRRNHSHSMLRNREKEDDDDKLDNIISFQGGKRIIDRRKFNALLKPPSRLATDIKFIPNSKDGKPYGIRISHLKPGSFFTRVGLRSGDIFVKINNKELKSVEDSFYAYQAFKNEDHLTLEIDRNGKKVTIPLEFR